MKVFCDLDKLPDPDKLLLLAQMVDFFDRKFNKPIKSNSIQDQLREWAFYLKNLEDECGCQRKRI